MAINFAGYLFQDDGDVVSGATVQLLQVSDNAEEASTTTNSDGYWAFSEADQDRYYVKITAGTSVRYLRWADEISLKEIDVRNNEANTTPAATFTNLTNNASNQVAVFSGANTSRADDDEIYTSFKLANSAAELIEYGRMTVVAKDVTDGTEDGQIEFDVMKAGTLTKVWTITSSDAAAMSFDMNVDSLTIGSGADTDISLTFDANTADGVITWMEDEDYFQFSDDILMSTTERINLRDTAIYIYSSADGQLDLVADTEIQIAATTIDINGAVALDGAITGATNITLSGELDAATLDISGNADIDGTLEADAITVDGTALNEYIADTVGAMVGSNTETNITVTYEDGDNTLDFVIGTLNQDTTGTAAIATTVTITDNESTNEDNALIFTAGGDVDGGNLGLESDGTLTYNPSTGKVTATGFIGTLTGNVTGDVTGNVTGNTSGTAATVTSGTQASITTVANVTTVGALNAGSITSGFGTIDTGSSTITTTGLISGGSLDIDNVLINGTTIGHTDDTDLMTVADGVLTVAGEVDAATLDISGNADIDGTTNLDAVDIDGNVQLDGTFTVGVDDTGKDVKFFGATSGAYTLWDESENEFILAGAARMGIGTTNTNMIFNIEDGAGGSDYVRLGGSTTTTGNMAYITRDKASGSTNSPVVRLRQNNSGDDQDTLLVEQDGTGNILNLKDGGTSIFSVADGGNVFIGDTANAGSTLGLTINQGANDDEAIALKSSDITHGRTSYAETDTYATFKKRNGANGGLRITSFQDTDDAADSLALTTYRRGQPNDLGTAAVSDYGAIDLFVTCHNGSNGAVNVDDDKAIFSVSRRTSGNISAAFIVNSTGEIHSDASATVDVFDEEDDVMLVRAFDLARNKESDKKTLIKSGWDKFANKFEDRLVELGILGKKINEGGMLNLTKLLFLHNGAIFQEFEKRQALEDKVKILESKLQAIGG